MENQIQIDIELVKNALFEKDIIIQKQGMMIQQLQIQLNSLKKPFVDSKLQQTTKEKMP